MSCRGHSADGRNVAAFTLIELLVVVAIISLLVSILLPSLAKAKTLARTVACQTQLRQIGSAIALYANDYDGYMLSAEVTLAPSDFPPGEYNYYTRWYDWLRVKYLEGPVENYRDPFNPQFITTCPEEDLEMSARAGYGMNVYAPGCTGYWATYYHNNPPGKFDEVVTGLSQSVYVTDTTNPVWNLAGNIYQSHPDGAAQWWGTPASRHAGESFNVLFLDLHLENARWPEQVRDGSHLWNLFGVSGCGL